MDYRIQIVTNMARQALIFASYEAAEAAGFKLSGQRSGGNPLREELRDKPKFEHLCGPMWGGWRDASGEGIYFKDSRDRPDGEIASYSPSAGPVDHYLVRYEDAGSNDLLSR